MLRAPLWLTFCVSAAVATHVAADVSLPAASAQAYDNYVHAASAQQTPGRLFFESKPDRTSIESRLKAGEMFVQRIPTTTKIPDAQVHHYVASIFIPGATIDSTLRVTTDFARYSEIFKPSVRQSRALGKIGTTDRMFLQIYIKKTIATTLNTEHTVNLQRLDSARAFSQSHATRIAELDGDTEKQPGTDRGFLWKQDSFWTLVERDSGVYLQVEWISLSRDNWLLKSIIASAHREFLELLVRNTRSEVSKTAAASAAR